MAVPAPALHSSVPSPQFFALKKSLPNFSVVEPFHFDPAPAPASQDGGSSSSSSNVVHNFLAVKKL